MRLICNGRFYPQLHCWGFVHSEFYPLCELINNWFSRLGKYEFNYCQADLSMGLSLIDAGVSISGNCLIAKTNSNWTALFMDHPSGPRTEIPQLAKIGKTESLLISCVEKAVIREHEVIANEAVAFELYDHRYRDNLYLRRAVSLTNGPVGWEFFESGQPLSFEQVKLYKNRDKALRFSPITLEEYCQNLGIDVFNDAFYCNEMCIVIQQS